MPALTNGSNSEALSRRHRCWAISRSLKAMVRPRRREPEPYGRERGFDRVAGADMDPVLGREVEEGEQLVLVPAERLDCLGILRAVLLTEALDLLQGGFA